MAYELNDNHIPHGYDSLEQHRRRHTNTGTGSLDQIHDAQQNDWVHFRMLNLAGDDLLECDRTPITQGQQTTRDFDGVTCPHCVTSLAQSWASFYEFALPMAEDERNGF